MKPLEATATKHRMELMQRHFPQGVTPDMLRLLDEVEGLLKKAYIAGKQFADQAALQSWSNQSCFGYMIMAAERIGMDEEDIQRMVHAMHTLHDTISLEEAASRYCNSPY